MPLDREIILTLEGRSSRDENGNYIPGLKAFLPVWASKQDKYLKQVIEEGGKRTEAMRTYRIRWLEVLQYAEADQLTVNDYSTDTVGKLIVWYCLNITEHTGRNMDTRRRFMDLEIGRTK